MVISINKMVAVVLAVVELDPPETQVWKVKVLSAALLDGD